MLLGSGELGKEVLIEKTAQLLRTLPPEKLSLTAAAQAANVHLSAGQQITLLLTLMLTSKGVAGVPRASLVILGGASGLRRI